MKVITVFFILAAVGVLSGCATFLAPKTEEKGAASGVEEGAGSSPGTRDRKAVEVLRAIEYALSLENAVWAERKSIHSREDVIGVFRRGFGSEKAEEITDWVWIRAVDREGNTIEMLNPGEPILEIPDRIEVLEYGNRTATAVLTYGEKKEGPVVRAGHSIVATLENEEGTWKIYDTRVSTQ